jgi:hypothetical protein
MRKSKGEHPPLREPPPEPPQPVPTKEERAMETTKSLPPELAFMMTRIILGKPDMKTAVVQAGPGQVNPKPE